MRLMIVDDHAGVRQLIRQFIASAHDTVCECASGDEAIRIAPQFRPDAVTMDVRMPGSCGLTATRAIRAVVPDARVILVTSHDQPDLGVAATKAGAAGFVLKDNLGDLGKMVRMPAATAAESKAHPVTVPEQPQTGANSPAAGVPQALLALMVDACDEDCELLTAQLEACGYKPIVERVHTGAGLQHALEHGRWDLILTEYELPGFSGAAVIEIVRRLNLSLPVICVTGDFQPDHVRNIVQAGAVACLDKNSLAGLCDAVETALQSPAKVDESGAKGSVQQSRQTETSTKETGPAHGEVQDLKALRAHVALLEEKNRDLRTFACSIAHDLQAPLRSVRSAVAEILGEGPGNSRPADGSALRRIDEGCRRLNERIEALLNLARLEVHVLRSQRVCMDAIVAEAIREASSEEQRTRLELRIAPLPDVWGDRALLQVAFVNLLSNAFKFTARSRRPVIEIGATIRDTEATFFIKDNGVGFDMRCAGQLFQPFGRLHAQGEFPGIGLGLATAFRIIQRHRGRLTAESAPTHGATFYCTLPGAVNLEDGR